MNKRSILILIGCFLVVIIVSILKTLEQKKVNQILNESFQVYNKPESLQPESLIKSNYPYPKAYQTTF